MKPSVSLSQDNISGDSHDYFIYMINPRRLLFNPSDDDDDGGGGGGGGDNLNDRSE